MNTRNFSRVLALGGTLLVLPASAFAQPDLNNAPIAQNPPNWTPGGNRGQGGPMGNRGPGGWNNVTPEQRQQQLRQRLTQIGVTATKDQDALITYVTANETALQKVRLKWNALAQAARDDATPDNQLAGLLNDLNNAMDDERARRGKARTALETQLDLPKKPRLETQLMLSGLLGDEAALLQGSGNLRGGGFGPNGFGGGGFGGGRGGGGFGGGRGGF